jgi:uncharacterized membrane protein YdjX (TVP38/TMEM64 family)
VGIAGLLTRKYRWVIAGGVAALVVGYCAWLVYTDAPVYQFLVRLYVDKKFLKQTLRQWGILAPILFMVLQALQVVMSPIPGEATGFLGGTSSGSGWACSTPRSGSPWAR